MRLARFADNGVAVYGVMDGDSVVEIDGDIFGKIATTGRRHELGKVRLCAPCLPSKIIAVGLNYKAHAREFDKAIPEEPMLFMKPPTAVIGTGGDIIYPSHMSRRVDYEGELAVVIGKTAWRIREEDARDVILGYTCFNDVTARDLQKRDIQYTRAKGFDTFAPMGPWIETDLDPLDVRIRAYLNGEKKQDASTSDMIFGVYWLVSFISNVMTLLPGDVIATGTPSGVGPVRIGDKIEIRIDGIGGLVNIVV